MKSLATILSACLALTSVQAATFTWLGATDGNWNTGANWTGGVPVSANDTALIFDTPTQPVTANNIPGGLTLNSLTFAAGAGVRTISGNTLTFDGTAPTLVNNATDGSVTITAPISLAQTVTVTGGPTFTAQLHLDGAISGSGGLIFDSGISNLRTANSYTGATVVQNSAVLGVLGSSALGVTSNVTVGTGAQLQLIRFNATTATTIDRPLTLAGLLSSQSKKTNSGGASTFYSGAITLSGDARYHTFGATGTGINAAEFVVSGTTNRAGNNLLLTTDGANNTLTVSGAISGAGNLTLTPNGGVIATNAVSGNGNVTISGSGGSVSISSLSGDGDVALTTAAGTASIGSLTGDGNLTVSSGSTFGGITVSGAITGNRNLSVTQGILTLTSAASTFTGTITLSGSSSLSIADQSRLGNAANTLSMSNGALLSLGNANAFTRAIAIPAGTATIDVTGQSRTIGSTISGAGGLVLFNSGLQAITTLSGTSSFQGGLSISTGVIVSFSADANLGQAGGAISLQGGSLSIPNTIATLNRPIAANSTSGSIGAPNGHTVTLAGDITGTQKLTLAGGATYILTGTNTAAGGLDLAGNTGVPATLEIASDAQIGGPAGVLNLGRQNGLNVLPATLRATADVSVAATRSTTFRQLTVDTNGHTVTFNQPISGRDMTKTGAGTWILNTANTDNTGSNFVFIEQGTLRIGVNDALGPRAGIQTIADDAVLDLAGFNLEVGSINNAFAGSEIKLGTGTLAIPGGGSIGSAITGAGAVVLGKTGFSSSSAVFSGANTFSGGLTIQNGASLLVQNASALGAAGNAITINNGTLGIGASAGGPLVIDNTTNLTIGSGGATFNADGESIVIQSQLTGTSPLKFRGGSSPGSEPKYDVRLANTTNTFTGNIQLGDARNFSGSPAIIGIIANGSLGNTANVVTLGNHYFDGESHRVARGGLRAYADLTIPATRAIQLDGFSGEASGSGGIIDTNGHIVTIDTAITQLTSDMPLLKTGEGTLVLNAANTYTGMTTVSQGTLAGTGSVEKIAVNFDATLDPGTYGFGLLTVNDSVEFFGGTLAMQLSGTTRGSSYDALDVGGSLSLGGATLVLDFAGGFQSSILFSDVFVLADSLSLSGDFGNVLNGDRLAIDGIGSFLVSYGAGSAFDVNSVVLSDFAAVPEPSTWALGIAATLVVIALTRRRVR